MVERRGNSVQSLRLPERSLYFKPHRGRRPRNTLKQPQRFQEYETGYFSNTLKQPQPFQEYETGYFSVDKDEPTSYEEAMNSNHATEWQAAMNEELKALLILTNLLRTKKP
ncbi:hypothetical protein QE152_g38273 [Popillia japonica]|uniref:Uncharacterized protein n=1 Tax=Popillia japonica TaxID=7064 RepID=A0AAW1I8C7_POPJA